METAPKEKRVPKGGCRGFRRWCLLVPAMLITQFGWRADACMIPVYRYALEMWDADAYEVIVFRGGDLSDEDARALEMLRAAGAGENGAVREGAEERRAVNVSLKEVDLSADLDEGLRALWERQEGAGLRSGVPGLRPDAAGPPWMVVLYPPSLEWRERQVWAGRLSAESVERLLDSPVRREIGRRVLSGKAAVWVLLESGNRKKDDAAAEVLSAELKRLEKTIELPAQAQFDYPEEMPEEIAQMKVEFSLLRVSAKDAAEEFLVAMLLKSEEELEGLDEPMVFPVYGRGRVLCALAGEGISTENIDEIAEFITGPCSCQVKALSPGIELLMSADWAAAVFEEAAIGEILPPIVSLADVQEAPGLADARGVSAATLPAGEMVTEEQSRGALVRNVALLLVFGLIAITVTSALFALWRARR